MDLPGYGFANVPVAVKTGWQAMIQDFLRLYPNLKLTVQLMDLRHTPTREDLEFNQLLSANHWPSLIIANKSDKVKKNSLKKSLTVMQNSLHLNKPPLMHSALKKTGKEAIWGKISDHLQSE